MRCKVKWRADGAGPLQPEMFDSFDTAKERVWNEDETWQIISPTGAGVWFKA